jgi:uracil-DNA glycosylase family 4
MSERTEQLKKVKDQVIDCQKCSLYKTRTLPVIGQGSHQTKAIFVGEAPGANEDRTGVPFCGAAGNILTELLASIGCQRDDVYIANILKCRPPGNRDPLPNEIEACTYYLEKQIEILRPKLICSMGNYAAAFILRKFGLGDQVQGISKIHGQIFDTDDFKIVALYHPAVAVYNANMKDVLKKDLEKVKGLICS